MTEGVSNKNRSDFTAVWLRSQNDGLSHGLKIARQLAIFAPVCAPWCRPFESLPPGGRNKREDTQTGILSFIWYTGRDSNPQPSEPESDALSIEPPVRAPLL